jgi:toxin-antitoxin system PIN domain toxin
VIVDANVLLYAVDRSSTHHAAAVEWVEGVLNGATRVGFPVQTLAAFVRIVTHPRVMRDPLPVERAVAVVDEWLAVPVAWVPAPGPATWAIAITLLQAHGATGNLVPDALLAALAVEHGVPVVSADSDFARFPEVTWVNPVRLPSR